MRSRASRTTALWGRVINHTIAQYGSTKLNNQSQQNLRTDTTPEGEDDPQIVNVLALFDMVELSGSLIFIRRCIRLTSPFHTRAISRLIHVGVFSQ
jgi:hypothetical protein